MSFIVPALEANLLGRDGFGACLVPQSIPDPGGLPASGIVHLRGYVQPSPLFTMGPNTGDGMRLIFTLPAGMRPARDRWFTVKVSDYTKVADHDSSLCIVKANGRVYVKRYGWGIDGGIFFDGVWFFAESSKAKGLAARSPGAKRR